MASYGYKPPTFGRFARSPYVNSPGANGARYTSGVASALAGMSPLAGSTGYGGYNPITQVRRAETAPSYAPKPQPQMQQPPATAPATQQPASSGGYDLQTDPVLMQIQALMGQSDQQAQAGALKQRQQLLLGFGDPTLAASVLGAGDPYVTAAGQNPTSVLAGLGHQFDVNTHNLDESLNGQNLFYSGARILQQQEEARQYQQALADAYAQENGGLDDIASNLAAALASNQGQRIQGLSDAWTRHVQDAQAGSAPVPGPTDTSGGFNTGYTNSGLPLTANDYLSALMLALRGRAVAV